MMSTKKTTKRRFFGSLLEPIKKHTKKTIKYTKTTIIPYIKARIHAVREGIKDGTISWKSFKKLAIKTFYDLIAYWKKLNPSWSQIVRVTFGSGILLLVMVVYLPRLFYTYSITATVSAPVISISSPIEGILKDAPPIMGTKMKAGDIIAVVENARFDRKGLDDMQTEMKSVQERIAALKQEKANLDAIQTGLEKSYQDYKGSLIERIKLDIDRAKQHYKELGDNVSESKAEYLRKSKLFKKGVVAENQTNAAFYASERASKAAQQAQLDVNRLEAQLKSIQAGIFVNTDGRTDVPYQQQRMDDVKMRQNDLDSKIREFTIREVSLQETSDIEAKRYAKMSSAIIEAPFSGVTWRVFGAKNSHVDTSKPIIEIVDCSKVFVDASVHERYFDKIKPGDPVTIKLVGSKDVLKGTIQSVRGGAVSQSSTGLLAGASMTFHPHEIQVMISINEEEVNKGNGNFCYMGRTGQVVFDNL